MSKKRVHEIAKELKNHGIELDNKEVVTELAGLGYDVKSHSSSLDDDQATAAVQKILDKRKPKQAAAPVAAKGFVVRRKVGPTTSAASGDSPQDSQHPSYADTSQAEQAVEAPSAPAQAEPSYEAPAAAAQPEQAAEAPRAAAQPEPVTEAPAAAATATPSAPATEAPAAAAAPATPPVPATEAPAAAAAITSAPEASASSRATSSSAARAGATPARSSRSGRRTAARSTRSTPCTRTSWRSKNVCRTRRASARCRWPTSCAGACGRTPAG